MDVPKRAVSQIDGCEVQVMVEGVEILLDIEQQDDAVGQWIILAMTAAQVRWLVGALTDAHDVVEGV